MDPKRKQSTHHKTENKRETDHTGNMRVIHLKWHHHQAHVNEIKTGTIKGIKDRTGNLKRIKKGDINLL